MPCTTFNPHTLRTSYEWKALKSFICLWILYKLMYFHRSYCTKYITYFVNIVVGVVVFAIFHSIPYFRLKKTHTRIFLMLLDDVCLLVNLLFIEMPPTSLSRNGWNSIKKTFYFWIFNTNTITVWQLYEFSSRLYITRHHITWSQHFPLMPIRLLHKYIYRKAHFHFTQPYTIDYSMLKYMRWEIDTPMMERTFQYFTHIFQFFFFRFFSGFFLLFLCLCWMFRSVFSLCHSFYSGCVSVYLCLLLSFSVGWYYFRLV